jgi:hypothetical protein
MLNPRNLSSCKNDAEIRYRIIEPIQQRPDVRHGTGQIGTSHRTRAFSCSAILIENMVG